MKQLDFRIKALPSKETMKSLYEKHGIGAAKFLSQLKNMRNEYITTYSGTYSKPVLPCNTIKNNDPATTYYTLSILELVELCEQYHEEDLKEGKCSFIELMVDYIKKHRKDL